MTDMIERVARAMCQKAGHDPSLQTKAGHGNPVILGWEYYTHLAVAALKAIREPTPEMIEAGQARLDDDYDLPRAEDLFQTMIDTALKTEEPKP